MIRNFGSQQAGADPVQQIAGFLDRIVNREKYAEQEKLADMLMRAEIEAKMRELQQGPQKPRTRGQLFERKDGVYMVDPYTGNAVKVPNIPGMPGTQSTPKPPTIQTFPDEDGIPRAWQWDPNTKTWIKPTFGGSPKAFRDDEERQGWIQDQENFLQGADESVRKANEMLKNWPTAPQVRAGRMKLPSGQTIPGNSEQPGPVSQPAPPETPRRLGDYLSLGEKVLQKLAPKNPSGGLTGAMPTPQSFKNNTAKTQTDNPLPVSQQTPNLKTERDIEAKSMIQAKYKDLSAEQKKALATLLKSGRTWSWIADNADEFK